MSAFKKKDQYHLRMQLIDNHGKEIDSIDYPPGDWVRLQEYFTRHKREVERRLK